MDQGLALIVAAVVAAVSSVAVSLIQRMRKENRQDHAHVVDALGWVHSAVIRVEDKVDAHIQWHVEGDPNGRTKEPDNGGTTAS
jgi:hypothetical protein